MKVLIAIDGSHTSTLALTVASQLLTGKQAHVTLLHVIPQHLLYGRGGGVPIEIQDLEVERETARMLLNDTARPLAAAGVGPQIEKQVVVGDPADLILDVAEDRDVDLIVLGSRGLNAAQRFLLGSVSTKVLAHAHCAVLVAHPKKS